MKRGHLILVLLVFTITSSAQSVRSFFAPYGDDWFIDLRPQDRSVSAALISSLRDIMGDDSIRQICMTVVPNAANTRPNLYVTIARPAPPYGIACYMLSYDQGSNTYLSVSQQYNGQPPQIFLTLPQSPAAPTTIESVDINGDGIPDKIEGSVVLQHGGIDPNHYPALEKWIKISVGTDIGQIDDSQLASAVFDYRIGYIAGYSNSFNNVISKANLPNSSLRQPDNATQVSFTEDNSTVQATAPNQPLVQDLSYDNAIVCTRYENLGNRSFLNNARNQYLLIGLRRGVSQGTIDAQDIKAKIEALANFKADQVVNQGDKAAKENLVDDYTQRKKQLFYDILDKPIYRVTFKNRTTGKTIRLNDLMQNENVDIPAVGSAYSSLSGFIAKMTRPVTSAKAAPFFKPFDASGNWYLLSPAMLSGQVSAYVNILAMVNNKNFLAQLRTSQNTGDFWNNLTDSLQENLTNYSSADVSALSKSWVGITSLEFREGYRDVSSFVQSANSEVSKMSGSEEAVEEIMQFMKQKYPQFNPPGNITTPEQAEAAIGGFVDGLYGTINQLDATINNLNVLLVNANNTVTLLQQQIGGIGSTVSNLNRLTNVLANGAEVLYWGSSVGVVHSVASWVENWF